MATFDASKYNFTVRQLNQDMPIVGSYQTPDGKTMLVDQGGSVFDSNGVRSNTLFDGDTGAIVNGAGKPTNMSVSWFDGYAPQKTQSGYTTVAPATPAYTPSTPATPSTPTNPNNQQFDWNSFLGGLNQYMPQNGMNPYMQGSGNNGNVGGFANWMSMGGYQPGNSYNYNGGAYGNDQTGYTPNGQVNFYGDNSGGLMGSASNMYGFQNQTTGTNQITSTTPQYLSAGATTSTSPQGRQYMNGQIDNPYGRIRTGLLY